MTLRLAYGPWGETLEELLQACRDAEEAGAAALWFPEMHRSATVTAALAARQTRRAGIGTGIALAFVRSPMATALEALDIDEAAGGRFLLGLGSGVQRLNEDWYNARWGRPVQHLRETVAVIRHFVAQAASGDPMQVEGEWEHLRIRGYQRPFSQQRSRIPIYLAGVGPAMTRLAGEIGDGYISHELCSPGYLRDTIIPNLLAGLDAGQRERRSLDVVISACCCIDDDPVRARRWAARLVGFYASVRTYAAFFASHGLADEQARLVEEFRAGRSPDQLSEMVPDHMVDAVALAGTADEVRDRLAKFDGLVDTLKITPPTHGLEPEVTRVVQARIIELLAQLSKAKMA